MDRRWSTPMFIRLLEASSTPRIQLSAVWNVSEFCTSLETKKWNLPCDQREIRPKQYASSDPQAREGQWVLEPESTWEKNDLIINMVRWRSFIHPDLTSRVGPTTYWWQRYGISLTKFLHHKWWQNLLVRKVAFNSLINLNGLALSFLIRFPGWYYEIPL